MNIFKLSGLAGLSPEAVLRHKCGTVPFQVFFDDGSGDPKFMNGGNPAVFEWMKGHVQGQAEQYTYFDDEGIRVRLVYIKEGDDKDNVNYKQLGGAFWDPVKNNIAINVGSSATLQGQEDWKTGNGTVTAVHFIKPEDKTNAPYIIAVPTTQMWTSESDDFPINTFTELPSTLTPESAMATTPQIQFRGQKNVKVLKDAQNACLC